MHPFNKFLTGLLVASVASMGAAGVVAYSKINSIKDHRSTLYIKAFSIADSNENGKLEDAEKLEFTSNIGYDPISRSSNSELEAYVNQGK
ncbi:hypothetical protein CMI38_02435 [Candidatus Pacearchaeota archaeon]|jgi:hypothetical protein|nr:hypothetical protein [Candidatus Pacearchaeota archaeon]|tara:strand:+ start:780 stop:1049 length:270 start_codon:yes stop_codon:yes gene_type:complete